METRPTHVAFAGARRVAAGTLEDVVRALKLRHDRDPAELVLAFDLDTGRQLDFHLRGTLDEVLEREAQPTRRGPGRPRLGVTSREVTLLPRHWEWLEQQPSGASAALRRLVEQALKARPREEQARRIRAALDRMLLALAGDRPGYEEASRALFAGDLARFEALVHRWPRDVRELAIERAREAALLERAEVERA